MDDAVPHDLQGRRVPPRADFATVGGRRSFFGYSMFVLDLFGVAAYAIFGCNMRWSGTVKRVISAFVFIAGFLGVAVAQTLSPRAFTEEIANAIRTAVPSATVWIERELEVEIKFNNGQN